MSKVQIHEFDTVIYPFKIWVMVNKTPDVISEHFKEYNGRDIIFVEGDGSNRMEAFSMKVRKKDNSMYGALIFFRNRKDMSAGLIAHESSHAAKYLFEHISADMNEHEPFEYVLEFIVDCCHKVKLNKFKVV